MKIWVLIGFLVLALPAAVGARLRCNDWEAMDPEQKVAAVHGMIEGHLSSNKSQRYTSDNRVQMRRCLEGMLQDIVDDIDNECASSNRSQDPVDDVFDNYLLSCVN
jgi:hypothetical protein